MKNFLLYLLSIVLYTATTPLYAFHIVGGEVTYECLGGNQYRISLNVYRDCNCTGCAEYDDPAYLYVFNSAGAQVIKSEVPLGAVSQIPPPDIICAETLPDVCVQETTYSTIVNLPPTAGGYTIAYQRYSRNSTIVNIFNPAETGSTYYTNIPPSGLATCNNSATFNEFPPTIICANNPMFVNQSATDIDGDSLVYEFCSPVIGGDAGCPQPGNPNTCPGIESLPPPYSPVSWIPPYNGGNPLGGSPQVSINPQTGIITGTPIDIGQYVVGICVTEYRNGVAINVVRRDFQFNVTPCSIVQAAVESDQIDAEGNFIIINCNDNAVTFQNLSIGATNYYWDFGDLTSTTDFSTLFNPTYTYPGSGTYYVTLIASKPGGCVDTAHIVVNLNPDLAPLFSFVAGCSYEPVTFTNLSTSSYGIITDTYWDYGDGTAEYATNPSHLYTSAGNYTVSLDITTSLGCSSSINQTVYVAPIPIPNFNIGVPCLQQSVSFTDITTNPTAATWQWDFGNPNDPNDQSTQQNPTYTYNTPGTYTVNLNIESTDGCVASSSQTLVVNNLSLQVSGNTSICQGETATITATGNYTQILWDGIAGTDTQTFTQTGQHTVVVTDDNGCSVSNTFDIIVNNAVLQLSGNTSICQGETATITATGNYTQILWDGIAGTDTQTFTQTGQHTVVVTDDNGCSVSDTFGIDVRLIPTVTLNDVQVCAGSVAQLNALANTDDVSYTWSNGQTSPDIVATTQGIYTVTVSNSCGEQAAQATVIITPAPSINLGDASQSFCIESNNVLDVTTAGDATYHWSTGSTNAQITITHSGVYTVTVTNECGSKIDEVCAKVESCDPNCQDISVLHSYVCNGANQTYQIYGGATGGTAPYTVNGTYNGTLSVDNELFVSNQQPFNTPYILNITDQTGCLRSVIVCEPMCSVLPIELLRFTGTVTAMGNNLVWTTANETNNSYFTLYRSTDEQHFTKLSQITAAGNSNTAKSYAFVDKTAPKGIVYYQLTQTDFDGTENRAGMLTLYSGSDALSINYIQPVPVTDYAVVSFNVPNQQNINISLFNVVGQMLSNTSTIAHEGSNTQTIDLSHLPAGIYAVVLSSKDARVVKTLVKNN